MAKYRVELGRRQFMEFGRRYGPGSTVVEDIGEEGAEGSHTAEDILKRIRREYKSLTQTDLRFERLQTAVTFPAPATNPSLTTNPAINNPESVGDWLRMPASSGEELDNHRAG